MSAGDGALVVGRQLGTVVVTLRGPVDEHGLARLEGVLTDLIHNQGNLAVAVDLTRVIAEPEVIGAFLAVQRGRFDGTTLTVRLPRSA